MPNPSCGKVQLLTSREDFQRKLEAVMTHGKTQDLHAADIFTLPGTNHDEPCKGTIPSEPCEACISKLSEQPDGGGSTQRAMACHSSSIDQLFNQLENLACKHQIERRQCLAEWFQRQGSTLACLATESSAQQKTNGHNTALSLSQEVLSQDASSRKPSKELMLPERSSERKFTGFRRQGSKESLSNTSKEQTEAFYKNQKPKAKKKKKHNVRLVTTLETTPKTRLQIITSSRAYEIGSAILIFLNSVTIGWQVQWSSERARDNALTERPESIAFDILSAVFVFGFTIELGLRWMAEGFLDFFRTGELSWCIFDVFVVGVGLMELVAGILYSGNMPLAGEITLLRVLRVLRMVKVIRVIQVMRFFRELRMMIWSIAGSAKPLMWVILVLTLVFYVFGILITQGVEDFLTDGHLWGNPAHDDLEISFATLDCSMLSLFMAMSGGNDWSFYYMALKPLDLQYRMLFLLFIAFSIFAVVNIVIGVFVQTALDSCGQDREIVVHEELEAKKQYCTAMREFFEEVDEDGSGMIGYKEFTDKLDDERVLAYFNALKLDVSDADTLFKMLDFDQSGEVGIDEFLVGCYKLQGESRNLDMKVMQLEVKWISESIDQLVAVVGELVPASKRPGCQKQALSDTVSS